MIINQLIEHLNTTKYAYTLIIIYQTYFHILNEFDFNEAIIRTLF